MTKAKEMLYPVGVEDLFIAFMTTGKDLASTIPTYDTEIYRVPTIETIGIAGSPTTSKKWASNKVFVNVTKNTQFTLTLDHTALPIEITDKMNGKTPQKGITFDIADLIELPYFAVGFIAPLNDGGYIARWYPKCQLTTNDESYTTLNDEAQGPPTQQIVMTANPLLFNNATKVDFNSARTTATGITAEDFMKQVVCDESQLETLFPTGTTGA